MKNDLPDTNPNSVDNLWASRPNDDKIKKWIDDAGVERLSDFINSIPEDTTFPQHKKFRAIAESALKIKLAKMKS